MEREGRRALSEPGGQRTESGHEVHQTHGLQCLWSRDSALLPFPAIHVLATVFLNQGVQSRVRKIHGFKAVSEDIYLSEGPDGGGLGGTIS